MCPLLHTHWERAVRPVASVTEFTGQFVQIEAPQIYEYVPALQSMQVLLVEAPVVVEYLPMSQLKHKVLSVVACHLPGAQAVHTEAPVDEYLPAGQLKQEDMLVFPVPACHFPAVQSVQNEAPCVLVYLPVSQSEHKVAPKAALYFPVTHWTQLTLEDEGRLSNLPAAQPSI